MTPQTATARVLTVEDDPIVRAGLRLILEDAGFDVCDAPDGVEAVELAREQRPDLILVGVETTAAFGEQDVPVVVLAKPLSAEQVVDRVSLEIERHVTRRLSLVEQMVRDGYSERDITAAVNG